MTLEFGIRNSEFGIPTLPPPDVEGVAGWAAHSELGIRNEELGIPSRRSLDLVDLGGRIANLDLVIRSPESRPLRGWAAFRIPNSEFRIGRAGGRR